MRKATDIRPGGVEAESSTNSMPGIEAAATDVHENRAGGDSSSDLPVEADGRLYHLGLRPGDVSNLVLVVGDELRARAIALMFDGAHLQSTLANGEPNSLINIKGVYGYRSHRGFLTFTGRYGGVPISVISTGMGYPNMDFLVRELRAITVGPLVIIRVGTCGAINSGRIGMISLPGAGALMVLRNYSYRFGAVKAEEGSTLTTSTKAAREPNAYIYSPPFHPNAHLMAILQTEGMKQVGPERLVNGLHATCDSFYGTQGRPSSQFHDDNDGLIEHLRDNLGVETIEMETGHLFHLAKCSKGHDIVAAAIHVIVADRQRNEFLTNLDHRLLLDRHAARIALNTLKMYAKETNLTVVSLPVLSGDDNQMGDAASLTY